MKYPLLDKINSPSDLKILNTKQLQELANEIRSCIVDVVSERGGHLAASLGVVELTVAIHYVFDAPRDYIVWDVGHQTYAHKLLTGRREKFSTLRQLGGISGFPNRDEGPYDLFTVGHSSTSISTALGLACARDLKNESRKVIAVIGDAALGGGMAFEALNHAGHLGKDFIVVLNDNEMSISNTVGALSSYLNRIITNPVYNRMRRDIQTLVKKIPWFGFRLYRAARRIEEGLKNLIVPGMLFEELGFNYYGPIDGHNITLLIDTLKNIKAINEPVLLHVITKKGMGFEHALKAPDKFHGVSPFDIETGIKKFFSSATCTDVFSSTLVELAGIDKKIVAITAAMSDGTGLDKFQKEFPQRFFDVGIAEEHAVGLAAGLARDGFKPVVAIYSTFLQRSFDQIIHDVALQNLHVTFAIDRAGLVGEDGPTHHGLFDIAYLRQIPNFVLMAPKDKKELSAMVKFALTEYDGPIGLRYPRGSLDGSIDLYKMQDIKLGKMEILEEGRDVCIVAVGSMVWPSYEVGKLLKKSDIEATVINLRFIKPLDEELTKVFTQIKNIVTIEEAVYDGGVGSAILEFIETHKLESINVKRIAFEDKFIEHGPRDELLKRYGLSTELISQTIKDFLAG